MDVVALTEKPIANPAVVLRMEFDDWAVLFNPDTAQAIGINPVGIVIWRNLDGERTVADVANAVAAEFDADIETVTTDVVQFVTGLAQQGLIGFEVAQA